LIIHSLQYESRINQLLRDNANHENEIKGLRKDLAKEKKENSLSERKIAKLTRELGKLLDTCIFLPF